MLTRQDELSAVECATELIDMLPSLGTLLIEALQGGGPAARLTTTQYRALFFLAQRDLMSGELARYLGVTPSSVTSTVDLLVHRGLAERVGSPADRRLVRVRLTPEGAECLGQARARMLVQVSAVAGQMGGAERLWLGRGLGALHDVLAERPSPISEPTRAN